jgi:uncharacterized protein YdbL (DUF1318 family)
MAFTTVLVTLGVGAVIIAAIGLVMYMSALVKNAYELKVELQAEMAESLKRIEDDVDKKAKWVKRDLVEEIQKSKDALSADIARRLQEAEDTVNKRLAEQEAAARRERGEVLRVIDGQKKAIATIEEKLRLLQREQRQMQILALTEAAAAPAQPSDAPAVEAPTEAATAAAPETALADAG